MTPVRPPSTAAPTCALNGRGFSTAGADQSPNRLAERVSVSKPCRAWRRTLRPRGSAAGVSASIDAVAISPAVPLTVTAAQRVRSPQAMRGEGCAARVMTPTSMPPRITGPPLSPKQALAPIEPVRLGSTSARAPAATRLASCNEPKAPRSRSSVVP